jgi:hypothetical protein
MAGRPGSRLLSLVFCQRGESVVGVLPTNALTVKDRFVGDGHALTAAWRACRKGGQR